MITLQETFARLYHTLYVWIGHHQQQFIGPEIVDEVAYHIHRAIIVDIKRGALALKRCRRLQIDQVGIGITLQAAVVLADKIIVNGTGGNKQAANAVLGALHLLEHHLQIGLPLLHVLWHQMQGSDAVFAGRSLNTPVYLVAIRAVAQTVGPVDHRHERRRAGLFLVGIWLVDSVALLSATHKQQNRYQKRDQSLSQLHNVLVPNTYLFLDFEPLPQKLYSFAHSRCKYTTIS